MPSAVILKKSGSANILKVSKIPTKILKDNELKIKIHYAGINYADVLSRKGFYSWVPKRPFILGFEASGEIIEIGKHLDAEKYSIGQKVIVGRQYGCYATEINVTPNQVYPAIPYLSIEENAAFFVNWVTSYIGLCLIGKNHTKENSKILISSAAGGVGTSAVQIAKALGTQVVGTVGRDDKIELLKKLGVDQIINYNKHSIADEINYKIDFCLESVGGKVFKESLKVLKPLGMLLIIGVSNIDFSLWRPLSWIKAYRTLPKVNPVKMIGGNKIVGGYHIGRLMDLNYTFPWKELVNFVTKNNLKPIIGKIFDLNEVNLAHKFLESRKSVGKILLKCK